MKSFNAFLEFLRLFFYRCLISYWARKDAQQGENRLESRVKKLLGKNHPQEDVGMLLTLLDPHQLLREVWKAEDTLLKQPGSVGICLASTLLYMLLSFYTFVWLGSEPYPALLAVNFIFGFAALLSSVFYGGDRAKGEEYHFSSPWRRKRRRTFIVLLLTYFALVRAESLQEREKLAITVFFSMLSITVAIFIKSSSEQLPTYITRERELKEAQEALARYEAEYPIMVAGEAYQSARHDLCERLKVAYTLAHELEEKRLAQLT